MAWLDDLWNHPEQYDLLGILTYYLMQNAQEVRRVLHKNPNNVKLADFKLKTSQPGPVSKTEATVRSKSRWLGWLNSWRKVKPNG